MSTSTITTNQALVYYKNHLLRLIFKNPNKTKRRDKLQFLLTNIVNALIAKIDHSLFSRESLYFGFDKVSNLKIKMKAFRITFLNILAQGFIPKSIDIADDGYIVGVQM